MPAQQSILVCVDPVDPQPNTRPVEALPDDCSDCHGDVTTGFGLAGGGYGFYAHCSPCDLFFKILSPESEA